MKNPKRALSEEEKAKMMKELEAYRDLMKVMASKILADASDDVDDAVNKAYLQAYTHLDKFKGPSKLSEWFIRLVINESLAIKRGAMKKGARKDVYLIDSKQNPRISYMSKEEVLLVRSAIQSLPSRYRNAFSFDETKERAVKKFKD